MKIQFSLVVVALLICCYSGSGVAGQTPGNERKANSASVSSSPVSTATSNAKQNEFNWRGKVGAGGIVEIFGVKGDIEAEASAGSEVEVAAVKQGNQDELPQVDVRVEESEGRVRICAAYPNLEGIGGPQCLESLNWSSQTWNDGRELRLRYKNGNRQSIRLVDVQVRFKVRIPMGVSFIARTLRGDITASFGTAEIPSAIDLVTLGGDVRLETPKAFNAHVRLEGGEIETDFPITVVGRFPGSGVEGSIGQGGPKITLSAGGNVVVRRALLERGARQQPGTETQRLNAPRSMPTVDQILDRYVQALGGMAALGKFTSRITKSTLVIEESDVTASFESYRQAPNKGVEIGQYKLGNGIGFTVSRGFNGTAGWALNPTDGGFRELSGTGLAAEKRDAEFYWEINLKELYPKMALIGQVQVGDRTAYCIEATPPEGDPIKLYFETQTGLLVRLDSLYESASKGKIPIETYYDDYRDVDGVKLSFTIRQPAYKYTYKVNEVKHNLPIEEAKFKSPGAAFDELSISRMRSSSHQSTRSGVLYLSLKSTGNQVSIQADLDEKHKSFTVAQGAEEIVNGLKMLFARLEKREVTRAEINPLLEGVGAHIFTPIAELVDSSTEIQFIIPGRFLTFPLDLLHFKGRPLFLQKPVTYSFEKIGAGQIPLSPRHTALILEDRSINPERCCQILKDALPSSGYYIMEDMNLTKLSSLQAVDILLISAHGGVQNANTDSMKMGEERLGPEHLSHLSPSLVYLDSCNLGVSAHFIQSFRDRGTQFYVAPILSNEAGNSSTKTIAFFFERLKAGDTPSKALFYTRKKLYEFYGEKDGFNKLLWRAFPFRVYLLN
jgi:hypothetical protein